jgi:hypothetical protein
MGAQLVPGVPPVPLVPGGAVGVPRGVDPTEPARRLLRDLRTDWRVLSGREAAGTGHRSCITTPEIRRVRLQYRGHDSLTVDLLRALPWAVHHRGVDHLGPDQRLGSGRGRPARPAASASRLAPGALGIRAERDHPQHASAV